MATDTIAANIGTSGIVRLSAGPNASGRVDSAIDTSNDRDWFRIDLRAGELYRFSVNSNLSFLDPFLSVRTASGVLVATNSNGGSGVKPSDPVLTFRPTSSGSFFLEVGDQGLRTGIYSVKAEDVPANTSTYSTIARGQSIRGDVQDFRDHDWHKVLLNAGQRYTFTVSGNGLGNTLGDPTLTLRNALGQQVAFNDDFGGSRNARIDITPPNGGTFFLDVGGSLTHTGSYVLSVN